MWTPLTYCNSKGRGGLFIHMFGGNYCLLIFNEWNIYLRYEFQQYERMYIPGTRWFKHEGVILCVHNERVPFLET